MYYGSHVNCYNVNYSATEDQRLLLSGTGKGKKKHVANIGIICNIKRLAYGSKNLRNTSKKNNNNNKQDKQCRCKVTLRCLFTI